MNKRKLVGLALCSRAPDFFIAPPWRHKVRVAVTVIAIVLDRKAGAQTPTSPWAVAMFNFRNRRTGLEWDTIELAPGVRYFLGQDQF